jgi:hypothetical protein
MSTIGQMVYDRDGIYIEIPKNKVTYSNNNDVEGSNLPMKEGPGIQVRS